MGLYCQLISASASVSSRQNHSRCQALSKTCHRWRKVAFLWGFMHECSRFFFISLSIFLSRKRVDPTFKAIWADNKSFDEVLISKRMVQDHMPDNVLAALTKVRHFPYTPSFFAIALFTSKIFFFFSWWSRIHRKRATLEKLCRES